MATDGSANAREALAFGGLLASLVRAEVTLLGVVERPAREGPMRRHLEEARAGLPTTGVRTELGRGHPAAEILRVVEEGLEGGGYDLLVVGARGQLRISRFLLGDTALRLAREAPLPLLIIHRGRPGLGRVLVCTAGAELARRDAELAAELAGPAGARVTVLHVMSQLPLSPAAEGAGLYRPASWHMEHRTPEGEHLAELVGILRQRGVETEPLIRWGLVVDEIVAETRRGDYDLVVVGAHRGGGLLGLLLDDVTEAILRELERPVLVVR